jgi:hypothetical protein
METTLQMGSANVCGKRNLTTWELEIVEQAI